MHYTDGSSTTFTQGISNWLGSNDQTGLATVASTSRVNNAYGSYTSETANVYGFALAVNSSKTVSSITLPGSTSVDTLAISEAPAASPPTGVSASAGASSVTLDWTAPASNVAGYYIYRGTTSGGESGTPLNSTPLAASATTYTDSTVTAGNSYYYLVKAIYGGSSTSGSEVSATVAMSGSVAVDLSSQFNAVGLAANGSDFSSYGGIDGYGDALSSTQLGTSLSWNDVSFTLGASGSNNVVNAQGQSMTLAQHAVSQLDVLAVGNGDQSSESFTVHYTDGTSTTFTQGVSNWLGSNDQSGLVTIATTSRVNNAYGGYTSETANVYGFALAVNSSKTVSSITLPYRLAARRAGDQQSAGRLAAHRRVGQRRFGQHFAQLDRAHERRQRLLRLPRHDPGRRIRRAAQ